MAAAPPAAATARTVRTPLSDDSLAPFLSWLEKQAGASDGLRYRTAHAAILLLRDQGLSLERLTSATRHSLAARGPASGAANKLSEGADAANHPSGVLAPGTQRALALHWHDRNLQWDGSGTEEVCLIGPPATPSTGRAQRKHAAQPLGGYSVRGLHALLAAMLERYGQACDPAFAARSPRDLLA